MSQSKKARVFSREFKLRAVERLLAGEGASALARELKLRRNLLYEWKDAYLVLGAEGLRQRGRPRKGEMYQARPVAKTERAELLQARQRIAELERLVGRQQLEKDFFEKALRCIRRVQQQEDARDEQHCTRSSIRKRREAN